MLALPSANALDFTENYESYVTIGFDPQTKPDQDWYNYEDGADLGNVTTTTPIAGTQSLKVVSGISEDVTNRVVKNTLEIPIQLTKIEFLMEGKTITDITTGSMQYFTIESSFPVRKMVEFYLLCRNDTGNPAYNDACQLSVRWLQADTTGQVLVAYSAIDQGFKIEVTPNWELFQFCLEVDDVNDGCFPFFELPTDIARVRFNQYRADIPMNFYYDNWIVYGAQNGTASPVEGDAAGGIKGFATNLHITSETSLFIFGFILFVIIHAGLIMAMFAHGKTNTIVPAVAFFAIITTFWLIQMEFWPDWIGITFIIIVSSMVGMVLRRIMLGIKDANQGSGLIVGALGYFIICGTFLAMAGYQTTEIFIPSEVNGDGGEQGWVETTLECIVTLFGDCSRQTESDLWKTITDIFGWIIAASNYLFQLMTFQLPIPVVLNMIIVLPPAAALGAEAIRLIRG